jgi:hypothetical protein
MFTGAAFSDPMQHAKMARDIGVDPIGGSSGVSGGYGPDAHMSEPDKTFANAGEQTEFQGVHAGAQTQTEQGMNAGTQTEKRKRPTLSSSETFTSSYEPKTDPFRRHVERVFEGIGVVQIPDFVHDSYDEEIMGNYKAHQEREASMRETHRKNLEERDKEHNYEMEEVYADRNKYKKHYKDQLARMREAKTDYQTKEQKYKDELSRLNQELQNARTRPAMATSGIQADEYEIAHITSRYDENKFNTGDKRRPSPFREQTRGMEPTDKYHIGARYEI